MASSGTSFRTRSSFNKSQTIFSYYLPTLLLALLFIVTETFAQHETSANTEAPFCDQNRFFLCPTDNQCIPREWLADGEPDCKDGQDESPAIFEALQRSSVSPRVKSNEERLAALVSTNSQDGVTVSASEAETSECHPSQRAQVNHCSAELTGWLDELRIYYDLPHFNTTKISLFRNDMSLSKIRHGCQLLPSYLSCIDGLPASCEDHLTSVQSAKSDWLNIQMYMCEFLVPSINEHSSCFGDPQILSTCSENTLARHRPQSVVCALVSTTLEDLSCIEQQQPKQCEGAAAELFEPLRSETEHVLSDLKCSSTIVKEEETVSSSATESVEIGSSTNEQAETTVTTTTSPPSPTHSIVSTPDELHVTHQQTASNDFDNWNGTNLADALSTFSHSRLVCNAKSDGIDLWAPIRVKICSRREEIAKHEACFRVAKQRTLQQCNVTVQAERVKKTCEAIDTFNKNIDCVMNALNEVCPADAQEIVVDIQEKLNDEAISHKCYRSETDNAVPNAPVHDDGFALSLVNPRCNTDQENAALACLVELIEINKQLSRFATVNFLLEISNENSTIVGHICSLYERYETCLVKNVFGQNGQKCSFNSPVNTLARIGLSPICKPTMRSLLIKNRDCLSVVAEEINLFQCQAGLQSLGNTVELMLKGIHGEALLCKSFYLLRNSFNCGEHVVRDKCGPQAGNDLEQVKQQMSAIGTEEGCPATEPADLDAIIAKPVAVKPVHSPVPVRPPLPPPPLPPPPPSPPSSCEAAPQKQFNECVRPLTAFQPHPLAVIKTPKEIDSACRVFEEFKSCRANVSCNPLWARGMAAMFEYTCGEGLDRYNRVKTCVRRVTTRNDIRDCVTVFSKSAPQEACHSSNQILACSLPHISEKCGTEAVEFVREYVNRFTTTIDSTCQLDGALPAAKSVSSINCTSAETQTIEVCLEPLETINTQLESLFQGGFQAFLKNVNNLASIFASGCNLMKDFQKCASPILEKARRNETQCVVSSCFMRAGNGICDQPDVGVAIENNLGCVFKQVSQPEFGKCLRSTIATLKQFNLAALRAILPKFVECVEPIVLDSCGVTPLNVLKALGSQSVCPVGVDNQQPTSTPAVVPVQEVCTEELQQNYEKCVQAFASKYDFTPVALFNHSGAGTENDTLCADFEMLSNCIETSRVCDRPGKSKSLRKLVASICSNKNAFDQRATCLRQIISSDEGQKCLKSFNLSDFMSPDQKMCSALNQTMECMARRVFDNCPPDSVPFVYDYTNGFLRELVAEKEDACELSVPTIAQQTGCAEADLIRYLECESIIDKYRFQPISIIKDSSHWKEFCTAVESNYRPCINALTCKYEPTTSANLALFRRACDEGQEDGRAQSKYVTCLGEYAESKEGEACLEKFRSVDMLGRDINEKICEVTEAIINCSALAVYTKCGREALNHVYVLHESWLHDFTPSCQLQHIVIPEGNFESTTTISTEQETTEIEGTPEPEPTSHSKTETATTEQETTVERTTETDLASTATTTTEAPTTQSTNPKHHNRTPTGNGSVRIQMNEMLATIMMLFLATLMSF